MKVMTKVKLSALALLVMTQLTWAQEIDEERMHRDLKIAEDILMTLSEKEGRGWHAHNIESNYMPGYGVMFVIPQQMVIHVGSNRVFYSGRGNGAAVAVISGDEGEYEVEVNTDTDNDADSAITIDKGEVEAEAKSIIKERMTTFLVDYADLIGQLKPSDKIVVQSRSRHWRHGDSKGLSARILKKDLMAYKAGKIDREEAIERIEFDEKGQNKGEKDLELFATIFSRLYEPDFAKTYYSAHSRIGFTYLDDYGATFNMKFYSSSSDDGVHTIRTTGQTGLSQEERNKIVESMYPEFIENFKRNLLDYGRTVKSLDADENLMFKVKLTECRGCEIPEAVMISVKAETLKDFDSGKLSREKAMEKIQVTPTKK